MSPLIRIFSPRATFGPDFDVLVLGNSFIPRLSSQPAHQWDVTVLFCEQQRNNPSGGSCKAALVRRSFLLLTLLFPSFPTSPPPRQPCGIPSHTSNAGAPIAGILTCFYGYCRRGSVHCNQ